MKPTRARLSLTRQALAVLGARSLARAIGGAYTSVPVPIDSISDEAGGTGGGATSAIDHFPAAPAPDPNG